MRYILEHLKLKPNRIIVLCLAIIAMHLIWSGFNRVAINYLQCMVQIVFVLIIYIWEYGIIALKESFQNMGNLFKGTAYDDVYNEFRDKLLWTGFETQSKNLIREAIKYSVVWVSVWIYLLYQLVYYRLFSSDFGGMVSAFLFSIVILLNGISYHSCISVVIFVKRFSDISDSDFKNISYNKYLPSLTSDFQKLVSNANRGLTFFLMASLLFSVEYTALIFNNAENFKVQLEKSPQHFYFTTIMVFFLGLITFLGLYFLPIIFFEKIVKRWKEYSIAELESKMIAAEKADNTFLVNDIIIKIEKVDNNQMKFDYPIINLIVALSTLLINVINAVVSVPSIYELVLSMISQE